MELYGQERLLEIVYQNLSCHSPYAGWGKGRAGLLLLCRAIKKTKVVNSDVFKCPYSAVVNYVNILHVAGLARRSSLSA
jgi:hypothetical protein